MSKTIFSSNLHQIWHPADQLMFMRSPVLFPLNRK